MEASFSAFHNNGLGLFDFCFIIGTGTLIFALLLGLFDCWVILVTSHTILTDVTMTTIACRYCAGKVGELILPSTSCCLG
jgi:hypothetical protein